MYKCPVKRTPKNNLRFVFHNYNLLFKSLLLKEKQLNLNYFQLRLIKINV